jgi:hypothetical protein
MVDNFKFEKRAKTLKEEEDSTRPAYTLFGKVNSRTA